MKAIDRFLQRWRMRMGLRWIGDDCRVIDVGAHEGELFEALGKRLKEGFGIEPLAAGIVARPKISMHPGLFPDVRPATRDWDVITMFAVLEHIPRSQHAALAQACHELLRVGGRVVITVPSQAVDHVLTVLRTLRLIDGMSLEEHFGFEVAETETIFSAPGFRLVRHQRFQLGLNHLFVFEKL